MLDKQLLGAYIVYIYRFYILYLVITIYIVADSLMSVIMDVVVMPYVPVTAFSSAILTAVS